MIITVHLEHLNMKGKNMNFQAVQQANGQTVSMQGRIIELSGLSYNSNQKQMKKCKVTDTAGVSHKVTIYGNNMPEEFALNQVSDFILSSYQGTYQGKQYTGYSGFWNGVSQNQQQQQPPHQAPPGFQQAAAKMGKKEPDWDAIAEGKVRHGIVCAAIQAKQVLCTCEADVNKWTDYVMGKATTAGLTDSQKQHYTQAAPPVPEFGSPEDDTDIPF